MLHSLNKNRYMMVAEFLHYLQNEKRYSAHTIVAYKKDIEDFSQYIRIHYAKEILEVGPECVRSYIVYMMEAGLEPTSVARKISSLRSLYKFGIRRSFVAVDPLRMLKTPKQTKKLPVFIESAELINLLDNSEVFGLDFAGLRDRLIIELLFGTGIRMSELLQIRTSDLDPYNGTLKVLGKRNKERIIPVPPTVFQIIDNFLKLRALEPIEEVNDFLLISNSGAPAYAGLIYRTVKKYLGMISTQDKRSPHVLRHTYATSLLNRGADLNAIKELLGHENLAATQVYVHNSIDRLKSVYKQAHPKA